MGKIFALAALAVTTVMGFGTTAIAQDVAPVCRLCAASPTTGTDRPPVPLRIDVETKLDFDRLVVAGVGSGQAELRPDGGRSSSGSVANIGARAMVAEVVIRGEPGRYVRVDLPASITMLGSSGGTITVDSLTSDLPAMPKLDGNGRLQFRFGGNLKVQSDLDGDFRGDVRIDVDYF